VDANLAMARTAAAAMDATDATTVVMVLTVAMEPTVAMIVWAATTTLMLPINSASVCQSTNATFPPVFYPIGSSFH